MVTTSAASCPATRAPITKPETDLGPSTLGTAFNELAKGKTPPDNHSTHAHARRHIEKFRKEAGKGYVRGGGREWVQSRSAMAGLARPTVSAATSG